MCPRATAQHGGAAMARGIGATAHSFGEEEYIDLDLSSCGEFEFRVCRSSAEEVVSGRLHRGKLVEADAGGGGGGGGGRRSTATVAPLQNSHAAEHSSGQQGSTHAEGSRRKKPGKTVHAKLQASRAFFRSLFARTSCSDERWHGIGVRAGSTSSSLCQIKNTSGRSGRASTGQTRSSTSSTSSATPTTLRKSIEQEKLMDEEEHAASSRQRKSFSGVIRWRPTTTAPPPPPPPQPKPHQHPPNSSTRRRSSCSTSGCAPPPLKRSSSARSESEGLIQGAIAYCKRSQQQRVLARKSVGDAAALCSSSSSFLFVA